MNICIVGGGHIGTTLACYLKHHSPLNHISLFTRNPDKFSEKIKCNDWEGGFSFIEKLDCVSSNPSVAAENADLVFVAIPHFLVEKAFCDIAPFISKYSLVGVLPGGGGCEFFFGR